LHKKQSVFEETLNRDVIRTLMQDPWLGDYEIDHVSVIIGEEERVGEAEPS
jgi:hypothetical protein